MDKYGQALLNNASKLDAVTDACGEIYKSLATAIVDEHSKSATIALLKRYLNLWTIRNTKLRLNEQHSLLTPV